MTTEWQRSIVMAYSCIKVQCNFVKTCCLLYFKNSLIWYNMSSSRNRVSFDFQTQLRSVLKNWGTAFSFFNLFQFVWKLEERFFCLFDIVKIVLLQKILNLQSNIFLDEYQDCQVFLVIYAALYPIVSFIKQIKHAERWSPFHVPMVTSTHSNANCKEPMEVASLADAVLTRHAVFCWEGRLCYEPKQRFRRRVSWMRQHEIHDVWPKFPGGGLSYERGGDVLFNFELNP